MKTRVAFGALSLILVVTVLFLLLAIYDRWKFGDAFEVSCTENILEYTHVFINPQVDLAFGEAQSRVSGGSLTVTVKCVVAAGEDVAPIVELRLPVTAASVVIAEPIVCSAKLDLADTTVVGEETTFDELGEQALEPIVVPQDSSPGTATLLTSCEVMDEVAFEQVDEVIVTEPEG